VTKKNPEKLQKRNPKKKPKKSLPLGGDITQRDEVFAMQT